jgi:hypothetical protein
MCVVAGKFLDNYGWVGVKNRDRNYKPSITFVQSNRDGVERLLLKDMNTGYTEGMNEFGVCILSAATSVKDDEAEIRQIRKKIKGSKKEKMRTGDYNSNDGLKLRTALLSKTVEEAIQTIKELKVLGNHLVFDSKDCYMLEIDFTLEERKNKIEMRKEDPTWTNPNPEYEIKLIKIKNNDIIVRTNHGIEIKLAGYQSDEDNIIMNTDDEDAIEWMKKSRESSEKRFDTVSKLLKDANTPYEMLDSLSDRSDDNPQVNPLRTASKVDKKSLRTTGQIVLIPSELTMQYRNIWGEVDDVINHVNRKNSKTYLDLLSYNKNIYESTFEFMCEEIIKKYS